MKKIRRTTVIVLIAVAVLLAALPSTMAWYSSQTYGKGAPITFATFDSGGSSANSPSQAAKAPLQAAKAPPKAAKAPPKDKGSETEETPEEPPVTLLTLCPKGNASCGYMTVTIGDKTYYSEPFVLGENGYDPQCYELKGIAPVEIGEMKAIWGECPEGEHMTLVELCSVLDAAEAERQAEVEKTEAENSEPDAEKEPEQAENSEPAEEKTEPDEKPEGEAEPPESPKTTEPPAQQPESPEPETPVEPEAPVESPAPDTPVTE